MPQRLRGSSPCMGLPPERFSKPHKGCCCGQGSSLVHGSKRDQILQESSIPSANGCSAILRRINTTSSGSKQKELNKSLPLPSQRQGWRGTPRANSQLRVHVHPGLAGCSSISRAIGSLALDLQDLCTPRHEALDRPEPISPRLSPRQAQLRCAASSLPAPWPLSSEEGHRVHH